MTPTDVVSEAPAPQPTRAFNGRHRTARVAKFNGALKRKKATRKQQRKLKQASQRRNRSNG